MELKGKEAETLYILGNGFDLYHGLESRYSDFYKWLKKKGRKDQRYNDFIKKMEKFFPLYTNQDMLWCNFEKALGEYKEWLIYNEYNSEYSAKNSYEREQKMIGDVRKTCEAIRPHLTKWAKNISIRRARKKLNLSKSSWFINFNYTRLLEDKYLIPDSQICHFHGSIDDTIPVITGHNYWNNVAYDVFDEPTNPTHIAMRSVIGDFNKLAKQPDEQIKRHSDFFMRVSERSLSHIVVIGHSLEEVDKDNFEKIRGNISALNAEWHFNIYQPIDRFKVYNFIDNAKLDIKRGVDIYLPIEKETWMEKVLNRITN